MVKTCTVLVVFFMLSLAAAAQPVIKVTGVVTTEQGLPLQAVTVSIVGQNSSVLTDKDGAYIIYSKTTSFVVKYSLLGYAPELIRFFERKAGRTVKNVSLKVSVNELEQVAITNKQNQLSNMATINIADLNAIPSVSGNFEAILKTLPGVSVNNELSAQYSVRGGNFDENLTYINDIEISRPVFIRNGQQEGLSFINGDLVSRAKFSSGGFEAKYGDKLSSVLDIRYDQPANDELIVAAGVLGSSISLKQAFRNSYLMAGIRYKNNRSVLSQQDVKGSYNPNFGDMQLIYQYNFSPSFNLGLIGNVNGGKFRLIPESRETEFGTLSTNMHVNIGYTGEERTTYFSSGGAVTATFIPESNLLVKWMNSYFNTAENENADLVGTYYMDEVSVNPPPGGGTTSTGSLGAYFSFMDNHLRSGTFTSELKAEQTIGSHVFSWGIKFQQKRYTEELNELNQIGTATALNPYNLYTDYVLLRDNNLRFNTYSGFVQDSYSLSSHTDLQVGVRAGFNTLTHKIAISPRFLLAYRPEKDNKILRLTAGIYNQDPDYRTVKDVDGSLFTSQPSQRSYNASIGYDYAFSALGTRLKFTSEAYFKYSDRLIPYIADNLKVRYLARQMARGYTYGADFTLGGEFVKDLVSYFRLSLLKANQDIIDDSYQSTAPGTSFTVYPGLLKRPTDQRVNFSVFFQDRLLTSPTYKVHLNLVYGSRLPIGAPSLTSYTDNFRIPAYKRADIGFSKDFLDDTGRKPAALNRHFTSLILYVEVFNMLNINNTASYLWLKDVNGTQYAIPNYLTGRQLNFKLIARFKGK